MMKQYQEIKKAYSDCLIFFRLGDFYELFLEDAHIGAKVLDITLTSRPKGKDGRIPMAGVPYHAVDSYLAKLVKAGYKVAICEQLSPPNTKGIIERRIVRVVTPGTLLDEKALERKENNFLLALAFRKDAVGLAAVDLSTGEFLVNQFPISQWQTKLGDDLARLKPSECILSSDNYNNNEILKFLSSYTGLNVFPFLDWERFAHQATSSLKKHFGLKTLASFGVEDKASALEAAAATLGYLQQTQQDTLNHLNQISLLTSDDYMSLDHPTIINLELFATVRGQEKKGSLLSILDQTQTGMGGRMLRQWLQRPLRKKALITSRQEAVSELVRKRATRQELISLLGQVTDIERLLSRLTVGIGNARDLINLKQTLLTTQQIRNIGKSFTTPLLKDLVKTFHKDIEEVCELIDTTIADEPAIDLRGGNLIKEGFSKELDKLRDQVGGNKNWLEEYEITERTRTKISSLKVRYNQVFGFYIEVSKANLHLVPSNYQRHQTLVNGERFVTPELKEQEVLILAAEEKINNLEYELFNEVLKEVLTFTRLLQQIASALGCLDCLTSFAQLAQDNNYVQPDLDNTGIIKITDGRHPVVEKMLEEDQQFVPNDTLLDLKANQLLILTGPNMAGKSVFLRQVALISLMAQIGCFVPASKASISVVDRIFVRSGASDAITSGLSTFMVEMVETAQILQQASKDSLIVMDEIGRGTSTYDGISLAWAVAEYLVQNIGAKTLFATHYHELQELEKSFPKQIKNYQMAVDREGAEPVFLHTVTAGSASHSYGVAVAKLAGLPDNVIKRAQQILSSREHTTTYQASDNNKMTTQSQLVEKIDINKLTPIEALNILAKMVNEQD